MGAFELQKNLLLSELRSKEAKNTNKPCFHILHVLSGYVVPSAMDGDRIQYKSLRILCFEGMQ